MASKRGVILTIIILAGITGASFILYLLPQDNPSSFVVTDYENHLDGVKKIHEVLEESISMEFQGMIDGDVEPDRYIETAEATSSQVTAQITEFVKSKPPEEWQASYISYMEALKKFNSYIIETKIVADMIMQQSGDLEPSLQRVGMLKSEYQELVALSDQSRLP